MPTDQPTIQAGIDAAKNGDTVLVAPGTYNENLDFKGKGITVTSGAISYADAANTIINGIASGPVVKLITGEPAGAVLNGFTIQGGFTYSNGIDIGAAVAIHASSPKVSNNIIQNNIGCGILVDAGASPHIDGNDIRQNRAGQVNQQQFAIHCAPNRGVAAGTGLGIVQAGTVTVTGNVIEGNTVLINTDVSTSPGSNGAGIFISSTMKAIFINNTIRNNQGVGDDGFEATAGNGEIVMVQNLFYTDGSAPKYANSDVYVSGGVGGASTELLEVNNTIVRQELLGTFINGSVVENNIFYGSTTAGYSALACGDTPANLAIAHNDIVGSTPVPREACPVGTTNLAADPQFLSPASGNFHTQRTSPVVAAGDINAPMLPGADFGGRNRTVCGTIDMGVYEVHPQPTTGVTSSNNPSVGGTAVTFTANVAGNCNVPTGTVTFFDGATSLGTQTLSAGASASITTASLTVGSHNITASYAGDYNFDPSTSATLVQVVTGYPTATTLTVSPNPAGAFAPITLSGTVTSGLGVPNGTVSFTAGGTVLATATLNANGQATATISSLGAGSYPIVATYAATTDYAASSSAAANETVVGAESTTALSAAPNPAIAGQTVSFTATVKAAQGSALPMGTVVFTDGAATLDSAVLNASGVATFSTASLTPGTHTITATYSGGANFNRSSASVTETVTVVATTASLTASPNPAGFGQTVTLTATVMPATGAVPPTGGVTFLDGGTAIGTGSLSAAGVATFSTATLAVGTHSLTAAYAGAGSLGGSTSPAISETIIASAFSLSLTPSTLTLRPGQTGAVTVQLASTGGYAGTLALGSGPLPAYVTGVFNPTSVMLPRNGTATATFTLSTQVLQAQTESPLHGRDVLLAGGLLTCLLAPLGALRRRRISIFLLFGLAAILLVTNGCSNLGSAIHTVAPGTYTIPVTAADANGSQKTSGFTLVIAQ